LRKSLSERLLTWLNAVPVGERPVRVRGDLLFADSPDRWLAALAWKWGWLEALELGFVERVVARGAVAVDVGANIGLFTLALARRVGPEGRVHAIEPEPANARAIARAVEAAGYRQVRLHRAAAADRVGRLDLHLSGSNRGDHRTALRDGTRDTIEVSAIRLDDLLVEEPRVDFIKIDVQGAELAVLQGLERTLGAHPEVRLLCEICPWILRDAEVTQERFFEPLRRAGLHPHALGRRGDLERLDEDRAWGWAESKGYANLVFQRG
jgi:FkbM family methyltransferase